MKTLIFLGYLVPPKTVGDYSGISVAGNKMQWNVVSNIADITGSTIHCITVSPRAAFPRDKKLYQKRETINLSEEVVLTKVSFINLPVLKQFFQTFNVYVELKRLLKKEPEAEILAFNMFPQIGNATRWIKKRYPQKQIHCLLADLPIDDDTQRRRLSTYFRRVFDSLTLKNMNSCDKYIVLNENVIKQYLPEKDYIVVDGGVCPEDIARCSGDNRISGEKNILFCGALTEYNGVPNLLLMMEELRDYSFYLDIYGDGYLEAMVKEAQKNNCNIRYYGRVSNETVMQKQREAWLLINPRNPDDPISKVTFPSKTFEYMLSKTPVLTTRLDGYRDEYENVLFFCGAGSPKEMAKKVIEIASMDDEKVNMLTEKAYAFVTNRRLWKKQTERICKYIFG